MQLEIPLGGKPYNVFFGENRLAEAGTLLAKWHGRKAAIVTDSRVSDLYLDKLREVLESAGIKTVAFIVPEGEKSKNPYQLISLYDDLIDAKISRKDLIIALGGGVVGDLTGFLAATYLRGVDLVQVPTTLLSQVDSSIGGKVAVDLKKGKNLIGTFYHPSLVIIDTSTLKTLDTRQLSAGLAEVVKYALIKDAKLFDQLSSLKGVNGIWQIIDEIIVSSLKVKRDYVLKDPEDKGPRMELNFGHTFGHALEAASEYDTLLHGEGVAIGMVRAALLGEKLGITSKGLAAKIGELLSKLDLPTEVPGETNIDLVREAIFRDKKVSEDDAVNMVFIKDIGEAMIRPTSRDEIEILLRRE